MVGHLSATQGIVVPLAFAGGLLASMTASGFDDFDCLFPYFGRVVDTLGMLMVITITERMAQKLAPELLQSP